jgi:hypothetical protein
MEKIKHALKNRMIAGCIVVIVIFGCLSYIYDQSRDKAEDQLNRFVVQKGLTLEMIRDDAHLRAGDTVASENRAAPADLERGGALWEAYRHYDYWLSIFKTFVLMSVVLIMMKALKSVLASIYVPKSIYNLFYQSPVENDTDKKKKN